MKLEKLLIIIIIASTMLAACTPGSLVTKTQLAPTPIIDNSQPPAGVVQAVKALAVRLNMAPETIKVRSVEEVEWPNACLGAQKADEACAEMIVSGFRAVLEAGGKTYEAHTNQDGSQVRFVDDGAKGPVLRTPQPEVTAAASAAAAALAEARGVSLDQVKIVQVVAVDWPNSCLGGQKPEESCLAAITPGYKVTLEVNGQQYQVNTNADGSAYRVLDETGKPPQAGSGDQDNAVQAARQFLAQQLGVKADEITLLSAEAVDWPNGCLGVEMPGRMCTQVITPGFQIMLEYSGKTYAFHTDQAGGAIFPAIAPLPQTADKVIVWEQTEGAVCSRVEIGAKGVAYGACGKTLKEAALGEKRAEELATLYSSYSSFTSATKAGTVAFQGQGQQPPSESEMRSIAEWSKLVLMEVQGERSGAAWGAALSWHREGGIAGFCNDLVIYLDGWAMPSSCKPGQAANTNNFRLSADQLTKLYGWVDQFERFEIDQKDNATADSMTVRLVFEGNGSEKASAEQQAEIASFAGEVYSAAAQ